MEKEVPSELLVGMQTEADTMESSMELCQKIKNGFSFWPSTPSSGNISKETQNTNLKEHVFPYVNSSVSYYNQDLETPQVHISRWIDKKNWYF